MKVVILGGYGVFGGKLAQLLHRDQAHQVVIAGRSMAKADAYVAEHGLRADVLALDRSGDLAALWAVKPDVVVDAAGPFHAYGDDPYKLTRSCIAQGVHYLDLADDAAFCTGITALDVAAREAGVFALSGVSSVPAISSAAVATLAIEAQEIDIIDTAILPGNRAPRGRAVVESILHQAGRPFDVITDGVVVPTRSWSQPASFDLGQRLIRKGWAIKVPDHHLFADAFGARTVQFRAGLELAVMNHGLAVFSYLRGKLGFGIGDWLVRFALLLARFLWPFGTDEGGMSVSITARFANGWQKRSWRLIARAGEGPFIPAVASRVILRDISQIKPGARPAVAEIPLTAIEAGMADLAVTAEQVATPVTPLFQRHLGQAFDDLPGPVQAAHQVYGPRLWAGWGSVTRGASLWARFIGAVVGFPKATDDIAVTVAMIPSKDGEVWERRFGDQLFRSYLCEKGGQMTERFGPFTFTLGLQVMEGRLHFPVKAGRLGPIPLPRFLLPQSVAHEHAENGVFHFDVALKAPLTGALIVHYRGTLRRACDVASA